LRKKIIQLTIVLVLGIAGLVLFSGCFATSTPQAAPAMVERSGVAPTAAMLPIINTYDQPTADHITQALETCLKDRNVFEFVSKSDVDKAVAESGFDLDRMFGMSSSEYAALANTLGVDYVIHGVMVVKKQLTFTGWRKDIDVSTRIYDGKTGKKIDSWRSMTDFTWTDNSTALDAQKMAESAVNHTCSKMIERNF
jgi:hypothetical protein